MQAIQKSEDQIPKKRQGLPPDHSKKAIDVQHRPNTRSQGGEAAEIPIKYRWRESRQRPYRQLRMKSVKKPIRRRFLITGPAKHALSGKAVMRILVTGSAAFMLAGCGAKLPACNTGLSKATKPNTPQTARSPVGKKVLVGIDGSGSMLGYAQASKGNVWPRVLQSITQGILIEGLQPITYRIGGGDAEGPLSGSVTQATDHCFFKGCNGYRPVASTLENLWSIKSGGKKLPLRILVSDLEVNQSDISLLLKGIGPDISKGASLGILGIKAPFTGDVFGSNGQVIQRGNVIRPLFVLATGPKEQVIPFLNETKKTLMLKGITGAKISIINPGGQLNTKIAKWGAGNPSKAATSGFNIRLEGKTYSPAQNPNYQFIRLNTGASGFFVATTKTLSEGVERPDFGIADIQRLPIDAGIPRAAEGMQVSSIKISGSNVKVGIDVDHSADSGLYRIVIPAGSMPEDWWVSWDRAEGDKTNIGNKTQGLLLLMTTLSRQIAGGANAPPAAAMCIALEN